MVWSFEMMIMMMREGKAFCERVETEFHVAAVYGTPRDNVPAQQYYVYGMERNLFLL